MWTYGAEELGLPDYLGLEIVGNTLVPEDKLWEQFTVVALPIANGLEVAGVDLRAPGVGLGYPGCGLVLACSFKLFRQGGGRSTTPADESRAACIHIVGFDHELLRGRLSIGEVALLAGVGALALSADGSGAHGGICSMLEVCEGNATVGHGVYDLGRGRHGYCCHA